MLAMKTAHSSRSVEIVAHEESTAQQELAQRCRLGVAEVPVAHFDAVEPRPIVLVAIVKVNGLFDGACVDTREAAQR